jgi:hypothetical protein
MLPVVGVSVEGVEGVLAKLKELGQSGAVEVYYSDFSLMEALAKAVRLGVPQHVVERGLMSIIAAWRKAEVDTGAWRYVLSLRVDGLRDLIDGILYSAALTGSYRFLTRDSNLEAFLASHGYPVDVILREEKLMGL